MPNVLIIEPHREMAAALQEVVTLANCTPMTVTTCDEIMRLPHLPAAIVVRILSHTTGVEAPHECLHRLPREQRPMIVALTSSDDDVMEAERLGCEVVLRAPKQVRGLYDALSRVGQRH